MTASNAEIEKLVLLSTKLHNLNLAAQKRIGISLVQWMTLKAIIEHPGASAGEIADRTFVHPSTLTQVIKRLEREKLILVTNHPLDSRKLLMLISPRGRKIYDEGKFALESIASTQNKNGLLSECIHCADQIISELEETQG